jgi:CRISPR-associated endonuclease/helicase Cas3
VNNQTVELHFPVVGSTLPADHAYPIFGALCSKVPELHNADWLGVHSFKGTRIKPGLIRLARSPVLKLRLPAQHIPLVLQLAGANLNILGHEIRLGVPVVRPLRPSNMVYSRIVAVKSHNAKSADDIEAFLASLHSQIEKMGVRCQVLLEPSTQEHDDEKYARRIVKIRDVTIPGYGVLLSGLNPEDSLVLQSRGLGGRRKFGCGLFSPVGKAESN